MDRSFLRRSSKCHAHFRMKDPEIVNTSVIIDRGLTRIRTGVAHGVILNRRLLWRCCSDDASILIVQTDCDNMNGFCMAYATEMTNGTLMWSYEVRHTPLVLVFSTIKHALFATPW